MKRTLLPLVIFIFAAILRYIPLDSVWFGGSADTSQYVVSAMNLARGNGYHIVMNGIPCPPRYPFGYPLCLAPFYLLLGERLENGVFCTLVFSLGTIFLLFLLARKLFGEKVALWAAFFLAVSPLHIYWSRSIMADIPSLFIMLLTVWVLFTGEMGTKSLFGVGVLVGFNIWMKYLNLLWLPLFALFFFLRKGKIWQKLNHIFSFISGVIIPLVPLLIYNQLTFGNPFVTLYNEENVKFFGNLPSFLEVWHEPSPLAHLPLPNTVNFCQFLFGVVSPRRHNPYPFFLVPFIGVGIWKTLQDVSAQNRKREFLLLTGLVLGGFYGFYSLFSFASDGFIYNFFVYPKFQKLRYLLQLVSLLLIIAAVGFDYFLSLWSPLQRKVLVLLGTTLMAGVGIFGREVPKLPPRTRTAYFDLIRNKTEQDAYVITQRNPILFYHAVQKGSQRIYIQLLRGLHHGAPCPQAPGGKISFLIASKDLKSIEKLLLAKKSVYLDSLSCRDFPNECRILQEKFHFREVASSEGIYLYRLEKI